MIRFIALSGFLGAGKTTTMVSGAKLLEAQGRKVALVTNDQGASLVDTQTAKAAGNQVGEVIGGCFCCRFDDLMELCRDLIGSGVDTIIAEAVGSCTDLQATVVRPLQAYYGAEFSVAPLTIVIDPSRLVEGGGTLDLDDADSDLAYLFRKQIEEADILAINKMDVTPAVALERVLDRLRSISPAATVVPYSAVTGAGAGDLAEGWLTGEPTGRSMDIDYDRYAAAEAELAWLNRSVRVRASAEPGRFDPAEWAAALLADLSQAAAAQGWVMGHAKVGAESEDGLSKLSLTASGAPPAVDLTMQETVPVAEASINARVACSPAQLDAAIDTAIAVADQACGTVTEAMESEPAFQPGYPTPVHRLAAAS